MEKYMEKLIITTKDVNFSKTLLTIIKGELSNWGYNASDIFVGEDSWGNSTLEIEVKASQ